MFALYLQMMCGCILKMVSAKLKVIVKKKKFLNFYYYMKEIFFLNPKFSEEFIIIFIGSFALLSAFMYCTNSTCTCTCISHQVGYFWHVTVHVYFTYINFI